MTRRRKIALFGIALPLVAALGAAGFLRRPEGVAVFTEKAARRDLEAVVRESGRVRAKTTVPLSASTIGQIKDVLVREGDRVKAGQLLIEIDPKPFEMAIAQAEAALADAQTRLEIARTLPERTRRRLARERGLASATSVEQLDQLETELAVELREAEAAALRVESERARLERERHELTKVRITSPIDGVVLRVNVEKGENVIMGTMNNAGTELMTVADLSVQEVELEVGEGAILELALGQEARVEVDAIRDRKFKGRVTEVGTSPLAPGRGGVGGLLGGGAGGGGSERSVAFRAVVTLAETIDRVRPGFSASAEIVTAMRTAALSVPIRALVGRELPVDDEGRPLPPPEKNVPRDAVLASSAPSPATATAGVKKKLFEGVMVVRDGRVRFQPLEVGIAGKEHVEVLAGLAEGDEVVTGPHKAIRELEDGDAIVRRSETEGGEGDEPAGR